MKEIDLTRLPQHIAIIMDGNGRWAERHAMGRVLGHRKGAKAVQATVKIQVNPYQSGTITNTVSVNSNLSDPNAANNTAIATTIINTYGIVLPIIRR